MKNYDFYARAVLRLCVLLLAVMTGIALGNGWWVEAAYTSVPLVMVHLTVRAINREARARGGKLQPVNSWQ